LTLPDGGSLRRTSTRGSSVEFAGIPSWRGSGLPGWEHRQGGRGACPRRSDRHRRHGVFEVLHAAARGEVRIQELPDCRRRHRCRPNACTLLHVVAPSRASSALPGLPAAGASCCPAPGVRRHRDETLPTTLGAVKLRRKQCADLCGHIHPPRPSASSRP
jgi:hypothetical protein